MTTCSSGNCGHGASAGVPENEEKVVQSLNRIKHKILVMSGKGGVGKSSVSVNLAISLAEKGLKVGLMDVDIHGPDIPRMLGLSDPASINADQKLVPVLYSDHLCAISIESLAPNRDDAIIWRGPMKFSVIKQFIGDVAWGDLDYLIIDSPPGTGDEPLTVAQTIRDAKALIVTTPQEIALADVRKSINFCKAVKMEVLGVIENMSGAICPHCGETFPLFGSGGGEKTANLTGLKFLGRIPFDGNMVVCGDAGVSFLKNHPDSAVNKAYEDITASLISESGKSIDKPEQGNNLMKFAIPLAGGKLTAHFGHCKEFAILDTTDHQIKHKEIKIPPPHEPGVLPQWLAQLGVNVVIAGGMGHRAIDLFNQAGIQVITGAPVETPENLVMSYLNQTLVSGENLCAGGDEHHQCGGHH